MGLGRKIINSKLVERFKRQLVLKTGIYFRIKKVNPTVSESLRIAKLLNHFKITKVLDVGANTGQFAESIIDFGYTGKIVSFEPVESAYQSLLKRANKYKNWQVADKMAIGNMDGEININVSEDTHFSSIKTIKEDYVKQTSSTKTQHQEKVPIFKLDSLKDKFYSDDDNILLKIDTQGFEKEVIEGSPELLKNIKGLLIEAPLINHMEIYDDVEWDITHYFDFLYKMGFKLVSIEPVATDSKSGFVNEVNCVFMRLDG